MTTQIKPLIDSFGQADPCHGSWQWIISNHPRLWHEHQTAVRDSNLPKMAATFKAMITAWNNRQTVQPGLEGVL